MEDKKCKKCNRSLPIDYKYDCCEHCRNKVIETLKKAGGVALGVAGTAFLVFSEVIKKE